MGGGFGVHHTSLGVVKGAAGHGAVTMFDDKLWEHTLGRVRALAIQIWAINFPVTMKILVVCVAFLYCAHDVRIGHGDVCALVV